MTARLGPAVLTAGLLLACAGASQTTDDAERVPAAEAADCTPVPGTRVCVEVPSGHEPGVGFDGYRWPSIDASLIILEFPGPRSEYQKRLDQAGLQEKGVTLLRSEIVHACGDAARLLHLSQDVSGTRYNKWFLTCSDENVTLFLSAMYPASAEDELSEPFRAAVLSAVWNRSLVVDPFAKVDWSLEIPPELQLAHETGGLFMYTRDGVLEQQDVGAPLFLVGPSPGTVPIENLNLRASAEAGFHQLAQLRSAEIVASQARTISGFDAWEVVGRARDARTDLPLSVYFVLLLRGNTYMLVVGMVDANADAWIERFRASADSWKPKG
jgi:hypothetical protein